MVQSPWLRPKLRLAPREVQKWYELKILRSRLAHPLFERVGLRQPLFLKTHLGIPSEEHSPHNRTRHLTRAERGTACRPG
jgi:hypothetical protein